MFCHHARRSTRKKRAQPETKRRIEAKRNPGRKTPPPSSARSTTAKDPYHWLSNFPPENSVPMWLHSNSCPSGRYTLGHPIPERWIEALWVPYADLTWEFFPQEVVTWLDDIIPAQGREWVRLPDINERDEQGPADQAPPNPVLWPEGAGEGDEAYYHPEYMLLYFPGAGEVYRLCYNMTGSRPTSAAPPQGNAATRQLRAPPIAPTGEDPIADGGARGAMGEEREPAHGRPHPPAGAGGNGEEEERGGPGGDAADAAPPDEPLTPRPPRRRQKEPSCCPSS